MPAYTPKEPKDLLKELPELSKQDEHRTLLDITKEFIYLSLICAGIHLLVGLAILIIVKLNQL